MIDFKSFLSNRNKNILVLDMGSYNTKGIIGKYENNKIIVKDTFIIPTLAGTYIDGKINDLLEVKERLKKGLEENNIKTKPTICTIESSFVISREIILPAIDKADLGNIINYEIGQYMPIELEKYVLQYQIVEEIIEEDIQKYRILVAALPKEIALSHFELLEFLDLSPLALDLHSNGISKLLSSKFAINNMKNFHEETIAVIDIGHNHINVVILENEVYRFSRMIDLGARNIDMVIANYLNIDLADIADYKYTMQDILLDRDEVAVSDDMEEHEIQSPMNDIIIDVLKSNIENWIEEINHVFKYYTSRRPTNRIDGILIYGGITALNGLDLHIANYFNIPTFRVNEISNIEFSNPSIKNDLGNYLNSIAALIRR